MPNHSVPIFAIFFSVAANICLAGITVESQIWFEQVVSTDTGTETLSPPDSFMSPIPADLSEMFATGNATYDFTTLTATTDPFELRSQSKFEITIDATESELGWNSVSATARAVGGLVDTAFVDGVPGQVGGFVEFSWTVDGQSNIDLNPVGTAKSNAYIIDVLNTTASLTSSEGVPDDFVDDQRPPIGTTSVNTSTSTPELFEVQVFAVDWFAGQDFDVLFELETTAKLSIVNGDAAGFTSTVDANFTNTAVLSQIRIYDQQGNILPDATITSRTDPTGIVYADFVAVPEPSAGLFGLLMATAFGAIRFYRRLRYLASD